MSMDRIRIGYPAGYLQFNWIRIRIGYLFLKNWIRIGSAYLFDFYNEIFVRILQDVTNDGAVVFFAMIFIFAKNQNDFVSMWCTCTVHSWQSLIIRVTSL